MFESLLPLFLLLSPVTPEIPQEQAMVTMDPFPKDKNGNILPKNCVVNPYTGKWKCFSLPVK